MVLDARAVVEVERVVPVLVGEGELGAEVEEDSVDVLLAVLVEFVLDAVVLVDE